MCFGNVSSAEGARAAVAEANALAPVAGILHLAMLLDDAPLASQARPGNPKPNPKPSREDLARLCPFEQACSSEGLT